MRDTRWELPNRQRVVVTGGREFTDTAVIATTLAAVFARHRGATLVEGGARGADRLAREWAIAHDVPVKTVLADWDGLGKSAGYRRNEDMLKHTQVVELVAFPGDKGTAHAVAIAERLGVPVTHA